VPAGGKIHSAPGRLGHHACRHYDRRARCIAVTEQAALAAVSAFSMSPLGKPGPMLSFWDESPAGENRGETPAGERARKRRAAQAAFSVARPARRLRAGNTTLRLPAFYFLYCRKRVDERRFVDETALTTRSDLLRRLVVSREQPRTRKNAPRERFRLRHSGARESASPESTITLVQNNVCVSPS
jgi:hypothetical protein